MTNRRSSRPSSRHRASEPVRATVEIESIAAGGEGVGRLSDGRVVFVHRTAPGDRVEISVTESRDRWARGNLLEVLSPSPLRREAPCPFHSRCGGCPLEHLTYPAQLEAKGRVVADALNRIGKFDVEPPVVSPSPLEFRYRNRVSFALRRDGAGNVVAGFHRLGSPDEIIDVDGSCLLPEAAISSVWDGLRRAWGPDAQRLPSGERLRLTLRATSTGAVSLLVEGGFGPGRPDDLVELVDGLESVWRSKPGGGAECVAGAAWLPEAWGDETLELSGIAFLQVNRSAAILLEEHVMEIAGDVSGRRVVDAYCGVGLHARRLARAGASVVGIELDPSAVAAARVSTIGDLTVIEGTVERELPNALPADLVILNPPRTGVTDEVIIALTNAPPERIIYVSCNPATLARDLQRLGGSYTLHSLHSFDLFPQTAHVESVVEMRYAMGQTE